MAERQAQQRAKSEATREGHAEVEGKGPTPIEEPNRPTENNGNGDEGGERFVTEPEAQSQAGGKGGMVDPNAPRGEDQMHPGVVGNSPAAGLTPLGRTQEAIAREHEVIMEELNSEDGKKLTTTSDRIRYLAMVKGHSRSAIAKALNIRYQHVRNVLTQPIKRAPQQQFVQAPAAAPQASSQEAESEAESEAGQEGGGQREQARAAG